MGAPVDARTQFGAHIALLAATALWAPWYDFKERALGIRPPRASRTNIEQSHERRKRKERRAEHSFGGAQGLLGADRSRGTGRTRNASRRALRRSPRSG